jgi:hypothetical protein
MAGQTSTVIVSAGVDEVGEVACDIAIVTAVVVEAATGLSAEESIV